MVFFSDSGTKIERASSRDGKALIAELNQNRHALRTTARSQGFYGATDRFQLSLRILEQLAGYGANKPGRKLVVWMSLGGPCFLARG